MLKLGRIKTKLIKRTSLKIFEIYSDRISSDFQENKELLIELVPQVSKKMRNIIAGYLSRLKKQESGPRSSRNYLDSVDSASRFR